MNTVTYTEKIDNSFPYVLVSRFWQPSPALQSSGSWQFRCLDRSPEPRGFG
jgi:hypothetical protein